MIQPEITRFYPFRATLPNDSLDPQSEICYKNPERMKTDDNDHEQEENRMDNIIFAKYDMDSGFIQAWTEDCNLILIVCDAVEKAIADNISEIAIGLSHLQ